MIKTGGFPGFTARPSDKHMALSQHWFSSLMMLALLLPASLPAAEAPDTHYLRILRTIDQADVLVAGGNTNQATPKYREAQRELLKFKQENPVWNPKVVAYRLKYVGEKIEALTKPPPPAIEPTGTGAGAKPGDAAAAPAADPEIKLLEAGKEPRRELRLQPKPGDKQSLGMTMKIAMEMGAVGAGAQSMKMPAMKLDLEVTVKEVSTAGDITYETAFGNMSVVDEPGVNPQLAEAMKSSLGNVSGLSGTGVMSSRGGGTKADLKLPPGADPQMGQVMEQVNDAFAAFRTQLPEEAVGPGARWEVKQVYKSQGMAINQTATYELASLEGDVLTLKSSVTQGAANQKVQNPAMPGLKMDLTKMTGSGTGTITLNLAQVLPTEATMDSKSDVALAVDMGGQKQSMNMKLDMKLRLESKQ